MLIEASLSTRTASIYARQIRKYFDFVGLSGLPAFRLNSIKQFLAQLHLDGMAHPTMLSYMSALKYHCRRHNLSNDIDTPQIKAILKGAYNLSTNRVQNCSNLISIKELNKLCASANAYYGRYEAAMVCCMFSMAFFGFLRVSEYATTEANHTISIKDCKIVEKSLQVEIRSCKFGHNRVIISLHPMVNQPAICPVKSFLRYMQLRPNAKSNYVFIRSDRKAVQAEDVKKYIQTLCRISNIIRRPRMLLE